MARKLMTNKRLTWAAQRNFDGVFRGKTLRHPAAPADRYSKRLEKLAADMTADVSKQMLALFRHPDVTRQLEKIAPGAAMDAISPASQARILAAKLRKKWTQIFGDAARPASETMVNQADKASKTAMAASLKELSGGLSVKTDFITGPMQDTLKASIAENVSLIKSIPQDFFTKVEGAVMRSITQGQGLADLQPFFEKQTGVTRRKAKNLALDQTRKVYNNLNRGRMQASGVKEFEWVHSGGGLHPRKLHQMMDGKIYSFDKLPIIDDNTGERGIPGQAINCGCTMVPVVRFDTGEPK